MRRSAVISSGLLHAGVVAVVAFGLPFVATRTFDIPPPIVIDVLEVTKVAQTDNLQKQPQAKPEPVKEEAKPPAAAKNTANDAATPVPRDMVPPEQAKKVAKPAEEAIPDKKAPAKKTPPKKKPDEKPSAAQSKDFSSVLRNLMDSKDVPAAQSAAPDMKLNEKTPSPMGQDAMLGPKMTMGEQDALRAQLEKCWNVPFGAKDIENMAVDIHMVVNPDRTLREARVVDQGRYNNDPFFRAAADSAIRAVRSPLCSPFNLPPDKYDTWNRITVTFNPKDMF